MQNFEITVTFHDEDNRYGTDEIVLNVEAESRDQAVELVLADHQEEGVESAF